MASQELWDAIDNFDYKEYLRRKGISKDKIPESLDDSRKAALFKAANDDYFASLVEQYKSDPFMKKADAEDKAREKLLEGRPWIRPLYGLWEEEKTAEELYSPDTVLAEIIRRNNIIPSANGSISTQNFTPGLANKEINDVIEQYAEAITSRPGLKYDAPELDGVSKSKFIEEFKYRNGLSNFETVKSFIDLYQRQRIQRLREQREADPDYNWQTAALKEGTIGGWEMLGTAMQYWGDVAMDASDTISDWSQEHLGFRINQRVDRTKSAGPLSFVLRMRNKGIQWRDEAKNDRAKHGYIPRYDGTLQDYWNEGGPWAKALWEQALTNWPSVAQNVLPFAVGAGLVPIFGRAAAMRAGLGLAGLSAIGPGGALSTGDVLQDLNDLGIYNPEEVNAMLPYVVGAVALDFGSDVLGVLGVTGLGRSASSAVLNKVFAGRAEREAAKQALFRMAEAAGGVSADTVAGAAARVSLGMQARQVLANGAGFFGKATEKYLLPGMGAFMTELWTERAQEDLAMQLANYASSPAIQGKSAWESTRDLAKAWADKGFNPRNILPWGDETMFVQDANGAIYPQRLQRHRLLSAGLLGGLMGGGTHTIVTGIQDLAGFTPERTIRDMSEKLQILDKDGNPVLGRAEKRRRGMAERLFAVLQQRNQGVTEQSVVGIDIENNGGNVIASFNGHTGTGSNAAEAYMDLSQQANEGKQQIDTKTIEQVPGVGWRARLANGEEILVKGTNAENTLRDLVKNHNNDNHPLVISRGFTAERGLAGGHPWTITRADGFTVRAESLYDNYVFHDFAWNPANNIVMDSLVRRIPANEAEQRIALDFTQTGAINFKGQINAIRQAIANSNGRLELIKHPNAKRNALFTNTEMRVADTRFGIIYDITLNKKATNSNASVTVTGITFTGNRVQLDRNVATQTLRSAANRGALNTEIVLRAPTAGLNITPVQSPDQTSWRFDTEEVDRIAAMAGAQIRQQTPNRVDMSIPAIAEGVQIQVPFSIRVDENGVVFVEANGQSIQVDGINDRYLGANEAQRTAQNARSILQVQALQGGEYEVISRDQSTGEMRVRRTTNTGTTVEFTLDNMGQYVEDSLEVVAAPPASLNRLQQMIDDGINRQRARTSAQRQTQQGLGQLRDPDLRTYTDAELVNLGLDPATIRDELQQMFMNRLRPAAFRSNSFEEFENELLRLGFPRGRFIYRSYTDGTGLSLGKWMVRDRDDVQFGAYDDTTQGFRDFRSSLTEENIESLFDVPDIVPYLLEHLAENNPGRSSLIFTDDEYQRVISKYLDYYDRVFRQEAQVQGVPLSTERRQEIETRIQQQIDDLLRGQLRLVNVQEVLRLYGGLIVRGWAVEDPATNSFMDRNGNLVKERDNMDAFFDDLMSIPMNLVPANHNVVEIYRLNDTLYGYDELVEAGNDTDNINLITSTQNNRFEELVQEQINGYIEKPSQRARRGDRRYIDRLNSYLREKLQQVNAITDLGDLVRFYVNLGLNMKQYATFRVEDNGVWMFLGKDGKRYTAATVKNNKSVAAITKWYEDETVSPTKFAQSFKIGQIGYTLIQEDGTLVFDYKFAITNKDGNELTQGQILSGQSQMMDKFKEFSVVSAAFDNFRTNDFINDELIREANSEGIVNAKDEGVIRTELIAELKTRLNNSNLLSDFQDVYGSQLQVRYGFRNLVPGNNYGKYFGTNGMKDMMGVDTFLTQEQAVAINDIWANNRANTEITVYYVFYNKEGTAIYAHSREEHLDALMIQLRSTQNLERIDLDAEVQTRVEESRRAAGLANARNQELRRQRQQAAGASLAQAQSTPAPSIPATTSSADQYLHSLLGDTGLANITNLVYPFSNEYRQMIRMMRDAYYATFVGSEVRDLNNSEHDLDAELMRLAGNLYKNAKKNGVVELYQTAIEFFNANQNARNSVLIEHAIEELRKTIQVTRRDVNFALELRRENRPLTAEQQGWVDEVDRIINGLSQDEREAIYRRQGVQGYWDSEAGRVILVAESIPLNHAHRVFAHELRVHATAHMTEDLAQNWINIADFLKSQMGQNTEVGRALDRIYRFRAIQFDETRWGFWEEMAAYFVEDYEGRIPFTANIKAHFRHWFRRSGIFKGNDNITAADIVVFAKAAGSYAINHHEQMKQATEGIPAQGEFFSRLGTAFSVPENVARTEFEAVKNHYGSAERNVLMGSTFDRDTGMYQESNLNDAHWTLVRTPFYKKWFGDWEMNPNTASKIVDTNGEPLVIVHNTQHDYSAYDAPFVGNNGFFGHNGQYVYGKVGENLYNRRFSDRPRKALFLNVRNPLPLHNYELMASIMERLGYEESAKRLDLWALSDSVRSNLPLRNLLESIAGFAEDTDVDTSLADYLVLNDNNITSSFPGATFDEAHRFIVGLYEAATTPANSILTNDPVVDSESIAAYAESIGDEATLTYLDAAAKVFDRRLEGFENQMLRLAYNPDGYFISLDAHHGDLSIVTQEPITDILSAINQRALILGEEDMLEFKSAVMAAYDEILALENVSTLQGNEAFMNLFNLALHKMRLDEVSFRLGDGLTFRTEAAYPVPTAQSLLKEHNRRLAENMKSLMIREGFDGIAGTDDILLVHPDQAKDAHGFLNPFPSVNSRRTQGVTSTRMEETVMGLLDDAITKDARTLNVEPVRLRSEYRSIYRANFVDQPWMQSNLDEYSWVMVRTPSFKQHYGEWQHDPTPEMNLDYRGEPVRESEGFIAPDRIVPIQDLEQIKANNIGFYFSRISGAALQRLASHNGDIRLGESESVALEMARRGYDKADIKFATGWEEKDGRWAYDLSNYGATVISKDELTEVQKELKEWGDRHASRKGAIESARRHVEDTIMLRVTNRKDRLINDIEKEFTVAFDNYVNQGEVSWNDFSIEELKLELLEYVKDTLENDLGSNLLLFHSFFNSSYSDALNNWLDSFEAYLFAETDYVSFIRTFNEVPISSTVAEVVDDIFNYRTMDDSVAQAFRYLRDNDFILDSHIQKLENFGQTWRDESLFAPVSFIEQLKLPHVFKQEELFVAYPFLRNVNITVEDTGTSRAWATPTMNNITLRRDYFESWPSSEGDLLEVFTHEIQHLIQYREGWPSGTSHNALVIGEYLHRLAYADREFSVKHKDLLGRVFIVAEEFIDRLAENNIFVSNFSNLDNPYNALREYLRNYKNFSESEFRLQRDLTYTSMLHFKNNNERLRYLLNKVTNFGVFEIRTLPDSLFKGLYVGSVLSDFIHAGMTYREAKDAPYNYYWLNEGEWEARYADKHARLTQEELNEVLLNDYMDSNSYYTAVYQGVTASRRTVHDMTPEEYLNLVLPYTNTGNKTIVNSAYFSSISPEALERMRGDRKTVNLDVLKAQDKELEQLTLDKAAAESALIVAQNERQIVEDLLTKTNEEIAQLEQTQAKKKLTKKQREKYDALIRERDARLNELSNLRRHNQTLALQVQDAENRINQLLNDPDYIDNVKKVNEQQIQDINDRKAAFIRDRANERVTLILRMGDINITLRDNPGLEQDAVNTLVNQRSAIFTQVNDVRDQAIQEVARMDDEVTRIILNDPMSQRQRDLELAQAARQSLEERINAIEERIQEITDEANLRVKGMGEKGLKQIQTLRAQIAGLQTQLAEAQTREQGFEGEFTKLDQILAQKLDTLNQLAQMDGEIVAEQMEQAGKDAATILLVTGFERDKSGKWWYRGSNSKGKFRNPIEILYNTIEEIYGLAGKNVPKAYRDAYDNFVSAQEEIKKILEESLTLGKPVSTTKIKMYDAHVKPARKIHRFFFGDQTGTFTLKPTPYDDFLNKITDTAVQDEIRKRKNALHDAFVHKRGYRLEDVYEDDDLYKAYPFLRDMKVLFKYEKGAGGSFTAGTQYSSAYINVNPLMVVGTFHEVLLHEIQHAIQWYEGVLYTHGTTKYYHRMKELQAHMIGFIDTLPQDVVQTITTPDFVNNFYSDWTNGEGTWTSIDDTWATTGGTLVPYVTTSSPMLTSNSGLTQYFSTIPNGLQKQANVQYPDFTEAQVDAYFSLSKRTREEAIAQMRKPREGRPDLTEEQMNIILDELDKYDNRKKQLLTLKWILNGSIAMPIRGQQYEDEYKVDEAIKLAAINKVDPFKYKSPVAILNEYIEFHPDSSPINPETFPEILRDSRIDHGNGIVSYEIADTREGQETARKIINSHLGKGWSNWCLTRANTQGELQRDAWTMWKHYNGLPKRMAFKNGKLISFMATSEGYNVRSALDSMLDAIEYDPKLMINYSNIRAVRDRIQIDESYNTVFRLTRGIHDMSRIIEYFDVDDDKIARVLEYFPTEVANEVRTLQNMTDFNNYVQLNFQKLKSAIYDAKDNIYSQRSIIIDHYEELIRDPKFFRIKKSEDGNIAFIVIGSGERVRVLSDPDIGVDYTADFIYDSEKNDYFIKPEEQWWDTNDESHSNLDWARGTMEGYTPRYSAIYPNQVLGYFSRIDTDLFTPLSSQMNASDLVNEDDTVSASDLGFFSRITNKELIDRLDAEPKVYDGNLYRMVVKMETPTGTVYYPVMATRIGGTPKNPIFSEPIPYGEWEQADERPELIFTNKDGKYKYPLMKDDGGEVDADYAPYTHSSTYPLNDQFTTAYKRPNLVVLRVEVPQSEIDNPYTATFEKDGKVHNAPNSTGIVEWNKGTVTKNLGRSRTVILSRYSKAVEELSDAAVADIIVPDLKTKGVGVPINVVTPGLLQELVRRGVEILDPVGFKLKYKEQRAEHERLARIAESIRNEGIESRYFSRAIPVEPGTAGYTSTYFSRTGSPLGNVTNYNTDIYDRTPVPGAPGAYKLRNGQIFINPDEVADEHVARNILYALIRENKQAMENKNIAAIIDTIKGWENSADTRERNFWATIANNIHLAGLSGDKPIIAYAAREFLNQHIDARNPQGTNTIEGVFAALLNEIPEIIGQVANTSTSNVNAMPSDIITVTNALGEVQNDTIEVAVPGLQITERDLEITQRRIMAPQFMEGVMEDIKRLIDTYEDADFQFIKGQGWLRYGDMMWNIGSNLLGMRNIVDQIMHGTIDYGNYDMTDATDEEASTPRSAFRDFVQRLPKDSPLRNQATQPDVEEFLRVFPAYIRDRIKVAYSREPEWEELFGEDKNGIYKPYLADREIIFIKAYDRTLADVVGTISYLVSRFGWTMWNNSDFAPLMDELYTVLKHNIKEELPSFFEKLQGNPPTPSEKAALVSAFISHMGGTVYELEYFAKKSSFVPSNEEQKVIDLGKKFKEKIKNLELTISKTFARDFAENEEITKEYVEKLLRLTMAPISGQGLFFAYDVDHDNLRQYDGSIPSSMQKWENLSHVTVFGNDYGPLYQSIPSSEDALTNMYMANRFRNASPYWRNVYRWWWRNRHPPMKRPGDTILGLENTVMLGRAFKAVTADLGVALKNIYKNVTALKDELMRKGIDTDEFTEAKGYEQELRDRGVTDEKLLEKAKITDTFLRYGRQRVLENVIEIRALVRYTSQRLEYWMRQENALSRDIQKMHAEMERFANRFVSDWDHRKYQAYTEDGQNDLHEMRTIINAARVTSERWYSDIVEQNKNDLSNLEKKKQTGQIDEKTYAKERKKLRHAIKIHERLDALFHWATQDEMSQLPLQGSPGYDQRLSNILGASRQAMINKIDEIMREVETYKERGVIGKMDLIPGARKRTLNENDPHDLLEMTFLDPVKDPALQLIFNLDQQGKITDKLIFNLRFGENLLAGGIATIKGSTETTPIRVDNLSWLENGTFLRYVQVDPFFMDEISNEVKLQDYVRNNALSEVITTVKQNLTILNWRMAISNYIGNISNLIMTGEIFRIQNLRKGMRLANNKWWSLFLTDYNKSVEKIPEKVFAKSINEASAEYNELIKMYQHEMDKLNIWGSGISSAEITMYGRGGWEKHVDLIAAALQTASEMANTDTFDEVTRRKWQRAAHSFMRSAREFYGFGDEWVKPLTYLNNRAVALAKYRALHNWSRYEGFENTQEAKQINEQIMDAATREAALLTFKETTTWELSPDIVRQLARTRVRVLTPDFLLHAFQMVRIYATNLYRTKEVAEEIARLRAKGKENLNPYEEAYLSLLRNEFWRRTAGQGIYTWIAAELATYGGSSLAWIFGSFAAFLSGGGGDDDEKRKKRKEERENSPFGTTFDEHVGMSMLLTGISQVGNLYMPLMWVPGKVGHEFYAYNGQRAHAALTVTPVTPPTTDPSWLERFNIILRQIINYDSDPLSLQIANIVRQKNSFGQKITGKEQFFEALGLLTPQFIQQGINIGRGTNELMTGTEELPWRERKKHRELAMFDVAGFKVQRVSVDDNIENLGRMIDNLASTGRNPYRREFFKKLENNLDMDESAIKSAVDDILTVNERDMGRVRWILESFRKMGVEKKRLESHLAAARNTGSTILGKQYVGQLLAGRNVLNSLLLTSLNEKISSAEKLREGTDFPPNERRKVIDNYRRAMRMIQGADL